MRRVIGLCQRRLHGVCRVGSFGECAHEGCQSCFVAFPALKNGIEDHAILVCENESLLEHLKPIDDCNIEFSILLTIYSRTVHGIDQ